MKTYKIYWLDSYLLDDNWGSINKLKEYFPIIEHTEKEDSWVDCNHCHKVKAKNTNDLKMKVIEYFDNLGRIIDVFDVVDSKNNVILMEEDF